MNRRRTERPDIVLPYEYEPRSYQREPFVARDERGLDRFVLDWHRKSGKDLTCWNFTIRESQKRVGMYWYALPTIEQGKKVIWNGFSKDVVVGEGGAMRGFKFLDHIPKALLAKKPNDSDHIVTLRNGSMITVLGTENLNSVVGPNPVGVVFSEYSVQHPAAWQQVVSPILEQNGGWAIFNFTPRGTNHAFELYENALRNPHRWFVSIKGIGDTRRDAPGERGGHIISPEQVAQLRREGQDEDWIQQEYYCSFTGSFSGSYYGRILAEMQRPERMQIREVPWRPDCPVFTVQDLGRADANGIWFLQWVGLELHAIKYYENSGQGMPHYIRYIQSQPYQYSAHWAPHDIGVTEYATDEKRIDTARKMGINYRMVPKLSLDEGHDAVRRLLPRTYFDRENCKQGLRCLQNYARAEKPNGELEDYPKHNEWSHGADAFRYAALIADQNSADFLTPPSVEREFDIFEESPGGAPRDRGNFDVFNS